MAQAVATPKKKINRTKWNVFLDLALVFAFVVEMEERFSGLPMHEVLGLVFGGGLILHIILHWDWVVSTTRTLFKKIVHESRLNYVLNFALYVDLLVVTITGIGISRTLRLNLAVPHNWETLHIVSSELSLVLIGLHIAMHWKWIMTNVPKYIFDRLSRSNTTNKSITEVMHGTSR